MHRRIGRCGDLRSHASGLRRLVTVLLPFPVEVFLISLFMSRHRRVPLSRFQLKSVAPIRDMRDEKLVRGATYYPTLALVCHAEHPCPEAIALKFGRHAIS